MKGRAIHILNGLSDSKILYLRGKRAHIWMVMAGHCRDTGNTLKNYAEKTPEGMFYDYDAS